MSPLKLYNALQKVLLDRAALDPSSRFQNNPNVSRHWERGMDREAWHAAVPGITKSQTCLSEWTANVSAFNLTLSTLNSSLYEIPNLRLNLKENIKTDKR